MGCDSVFEFSDSQQILGWLFAISVSLGENFKTYTIRFPYSFYAENVLGTWSRKRSLPEIFSFSSLTTTKFTAYMYIHWPCTLTIHVPHPCTYMYSWHGQYTLKHVHCIIYLIHVHVPCTCTLTCKPVQLYTTCTVQYTCTQHVLHVHCIIYADKFSYSHMHRIEY